MSRCRISSTACTASRTSQGFLEIEVGLDADLGREDRGRSQEFDELDVDLELADEVDERGVAGRHHGRRIGTLLTTRTRHIDEAREEVEDAAEAVDLAAVRLVRAVAENVADVEPGTDGEGECA